MREYFARSPVATATTCGSYNRCRARITLPDLGPIYRLLRSKTRWQTDVWSMTFKRLEEKKSIPEGQTVSNYMAIRNGPMRSAVFSHIGRRIPTHRLAPLLGSPITVQSLWWIVVEYKTKISFHNRATPITHVRLSDVFAFSAFQNLPQ